MIRVRPGVSLEAQGTDTLATANRTFGELILSTPERIRAGQWGDEAAFSQTELCRTVHYLRNGQIYVPGLGVLAAVPLCTVRTLGIIGPDRRDIHDGFMVAVKLPRFVLSNTWWPLHVHDFEDVQAQETEKILAVWMNSTMGILS